MRPSTAYLTTQRRHGIGIHGETKSKAPTGIIPPVHCDVQRGLPNEEKSKTSKSKSKIEYLRRLALLYRERYRRFVAGLMFNEVLHILSSLRELARLYLEKCTDITPNFTQERDTDGAQNWSRRRAPRPILGGVSRFCVQFWRDFQPNRAEICPSSVCNCSTITYWGLM